MRNPISKSEIESNWRRHRKLASRLYKCTHLCTYPWTHTHTHTHISLWLQTRNIYSIFRCKTYLWGVYTYCSCILNENYSLKKIFHGFADLCLQTLFLWGTDRVQSTFNPGICPVTMAYILRGNNTQKKLDCSLKTAVWTSLHTELIEERSANIPSEDL